MRPPIEGEGGGDGYDSVDDDDWANYSVVDEAEEYSDDSDRHLTVPEQREKRERDLRHGDLEEERERSAALDDDEVDPEVTFRLEMEREPMPTATARSGLGQWGSLKSYIKGARHYNHYDKATLAERRSYNNQDYQTGMA